MARPKKTRTSTKSATARGRKTTTKSTARGKAKQTKEFHPHKERAQMTTNLKAQTAEIKLLKGNDLTRRPPKNPDMPKDIIDNLNTDFNSIKELLDAFSQHLRALDRMRLNGVGIKKLGFINAAYASALENGEFLPHYLTLERFGTDIEYFTDFRTLVELVSQIREKLWNITIQSADICRKAKGFSARSLRIAQTPHINSWSFAKHNTSQKRINFFKNKKNNKNCNLLFGKTPSYTA